MSPIISHSMRHWSIYLRTVKSLLLDASKTDTSQKRTPRVGPSRSGHFLWLWSRTPISTWLMVKIGRERSGYKISLTLSPARSQGIFYKRQTRLVSILQTNSFPSHLHWRPVFTAAILADKNKTVFLPWELSSLCKFLCTKNGKHNKTKKIEGGEGKKKSICSTKLIKKTSVRKEIQSWRFECQPFIRASHQSTGWRSKSQRLNLFRKQIEHFRVALSLCFKTRLSAKPFVWKRFLFLFK